MSNPVYFLHVNGATTGPHSVVVLQQMASVYAFDDTAALALAGSDTWRVIRDDAELSALLFPEKKKLQFTTKTFAPTTDAVQPVSVKEILRENLAANEKYTPPIDLTCRPDRGRRRDFAWACVFINLIGLLFYFIVPHSALTVLLVLGYFCVSNFLAYWVYFHVVGRD